MNGGCFGIAAVLVSRGSAGFSTTVRNDNRPFEYGCHSLVAERTIVEGSRVGIQRLW